MGNIKGNIMGNIKRGEKGKYEELRRGQIARLWFAKIVKNITRNITSFSLPEYYRFSTRNITSFSLPEYYRFSTRNITT